MSVESRAPDTRCPGKLLPAVSTFCGLLLALVWALGAGGWQSPEAPEVRLSRAIAWTSQATEVTPLSSSDPGIVGEAVFLVATREQADIIAAQIEQDNGERAQFFLPRFLIATNDEHGDQIKAAEMGALDERLRVIDLR